MTFTMAATAALTAAIRAVCPDVIGVDPSQGVNGIWYSDPSGPTGAEVTCAQNAYNAFNITLFNAQSSAQSEYAIAMQGGISIVSTGDSALTATYSLGTDYSTGMTFPSEASNELVSLLVTGSGNIANGLFLNGSSSQSWPDISGTMHTFNPTQFTAFARAMGTYVQSLVVAEQSASSGVTTTWPSSEITIP